MSGKIKIERYARSIGKIGCLCILLTGICAVAQSVNGEPGFALHDGETVVFYGDSITAQRLYTRFVEDFVLTRYPDLHIRFMNAGVPGDQVSGGYAGRMPERVVRDVQPFHPGMITVMLGMNDGWWGTESPQVDAYFKKGYGELLAALESAAPGAALTLIRPTPYDEITHGTEFPLYSRVIDDLAKDVSSMAAQKQASGAGKIYLADFHQTMIDALTEAKSKSPEVAALIIPDRIHPGEAGHWIMAAELLKTWHVDPIVSSFIVDAKAASEAPIVVESRRTVVTKLVRTSLGLQWTQQDDDLPLPFDFNNALIQLLPEISKIGDVDREMLEVKGLTAGSYQLLIDDKVRATFTASELGGGINLALIKTPMVDQAREIDSIENQRMQLDQARFVLCADMKVKATSTIAEDRLLKAEEQLATENRNQLKPKPHTFELRKLPQ